METGESARPIKSPTHVTHVAVRDDESMFSNSSADLIVTLQGLTLSVEFAISKFALVTVQAVDRACSTLIPVVISIPVKALAVHDTIFPLPLICFTA